MKFTLLIGLCFYFSYNAISQTNEYVDVTVTITDGMIPAPEGTFQFIVHNSKQTPAFTTDILYFIEIQRKENQDVSLSISEDITLYIPSRNTISSSSFEPLEQLAY